MIKTFCMKGISTVLKLIKFKTEKTTPNANTRGMENKCEILILLVRNNCTNYGGMIQKE